MEAVSTNDGKGDVHNFLQIYNITAWKNTRYKLVA